MTGWAVLAGALAAGLIAWTALALIALVGKGQLRTQPVRWFGAAALGALALDVAGLPVPWLVPVGLLAAGLVAGLAPAPDLDGLG